MTRTHLTARSETVRIVIPPHLRAAWHRRGEAWFLQQLEIVAAGDMGMALADYFANKGEKK